MANQQYQVPQLQQPPSQPTGQMLNTNPAPQMQGDKNTASLAMPADEAITNLGFANNMLHHLIEYKGKQAGIQPKDSETTPQQSQEETKEPVDDTKGESTETPDTTAIDQKISDLEASHEKEIMMLKHEMEVQGLKQGNEKKVADIETKHKQEIEDLKNTVKDIING